MIQPQPSSWIYFYLADLGKAIGQFASSDRIRILDYGCGGSSYRSFFQIASTYGPTQRPAQNWIICWEKILLSPQQMAILTWFSLRRFSSKCQTLLTTLWNVFAS